MRRRFLQILTTVALAAAMSLQGGHPAAAVSTPDLDLTAVPVPVGSVLTSEVVTTALLDVATGQAVAAAAPASGCNFGVSDEFSGVRSNSTGVVSGQHVYHSYIHCTEPQTRLYTYATLIYKGTEVTDSPQDDCRAGESTRLCTDAVSQSITPCSFCNGSWQAEGNFIISVDPRYVITGVPPSCTRSGFNTLICRLLTNRINL